MKECLDQKTELEVTMKELSQELAALTVDHGEETETGSTTFTGGAATEGETETGDSQSNTLARDRPSEDADGGTPEYSLEVSKQVKFLHRNKDFWSMHRASPFPARENEYGYSVGAPVKILSGNKKGYVVGHTATMVDVVTGDIFGPLRQIKLHRKPNRSIWWRKIDLRNINDK